jgi:hypothetical protein
MAANHIVSGTTATSGPPEAEPSASEPRVPVPKDGQLGSPGPWALRGNTVRRSEARSHQLSYCSTITCIKNVSIADAEPSQIR